MSHQMHPLHRIACSPVRYLFKIRRGRVNLT